MLKQALVAFGAVALVGCGGGDPLGEEDAQLAWEATQGAMGGQGATPNALTVKTPCPEGGKLKWKSGLLGGLDVSANGVGWEYDLVFKGCKNNGVKISGKMTYYFEVVSKESSSYSRWGYTGDLRYSGDQIKGSCEYDMYGEVAASESGASISYYGSICGHEASLTLNANSEGTTVSNNVNVDADADPTGTM